MRNLVLAGRGGAVVAAALLVATGIAVRVRPSGTVGPIPGPSVNGFWPTLAVTAALLVAIIATTIGAVSIARRPLVRESLPAAPSWDWREVHLRLSYVALAVVALVASLIVFAMARQELVPIKTDLPTPPAVTGPSQPTPAPTTGRLPLDNARESGSTGAAIGLLVIATMSAFVLATTLRAAIRRRMRAVADRSIPPSRPAPAPEPLIRATQLALQEVTEPGRAPGEAIIACFATMERALANTDFAPRRSDTAKEVIERAVAAHLMPVGPAGNLRDLFTEARFSAHEMTAAQQDSAARALHDILAGWRR